MKLFKLTLGIAVATATLAACNQNGEKTTAADSTTPTTATAEAGVPEIVYVNTDSLMANYKYATDVRDRLKKKAESKEKSLRSQAESFQKEVQRYQQQQQSMTVQQASATEQRLMQKQQQLQALQQSSGNELMVEESEEMKKIYDQVESYLKKISDEKGYKMVLTYQRGNSAILYSDSTRDITTEVLAGLNDDYAKSQTEEAEKAEEAKADAKKNKK